MRLCTHLRSQELQTRRQLTKCISVPEPSAGRGGKQMGTRLLLSVPGRVQVEGEEGGRRCCGHAGPRLPACSKDQADSGQS